MEAEQFHLQLRNKPADDDHDSTRRQKEWSRLSREWILTKSALLSRNTVEWSVSKINLNFLSLRDSTLDNVDSTVRNVKLFCKNQWFIGVNEEGCVLGTQEHSSYGVSWLLEFLENGLVRIFSMDVKRYLAMDSNGRLFTTKTRTDNTIFKHVKGINGFNTFSSHKYYRETPNDMFIALKKDGLPRKGNKTCRLHKGSQFLLV